jgi:hypothetical protein
MFNIIENQEKTNVAAVEFGVFERASELRSSALGPVPTECRYWNCQSFSEARNKINEELEAELQVNLIHWQTITKASLWEEGIEVIVHLPLIRMNQYLEAAIFDDRVFPVDLTEIFDNFFSTINYRISNGTYPN